MDGKRIALHPQSRATCKRQAGKGKRLKSTVRGDGSLAAYHAGNGFQKTCSPKQLAISIRNKNRIRDAAWEII